MKIDISRAKGIALALFATASWASFYLVSRYFFGTDDAGTDPLWSSFLRYVLASAVFLSVIGFSGKFRETMCLLRKEWKSMLMLGMVGIVGESTLLFYSMRYTTAARSNLLTNISPVATAVLAYFITKETFGARRIIGMAIGFAGILGIFFLKGGDRFSDGNSSMICGDVLAVLAGICWSVYTVCGKRLVESCGGLTAAAGSFIFGALGMIPVLILAGSKVSFDLTPRAWGMIVYIGIVSNAAANLCWFLALRYLTPGELGGFGYVSILMTFVLAILFTGEKISILFVLCLAAVLAGAALTIDRTDERKNVGKSTAVR